MIFSFNLLGRLVDLEGITPAELIQRLTFSGFEVEEHKPAGQATKLVSGRILSCVPHPDSDHLHVLKVDCGPEYGVRQIVCGAPNARADMSVIVALPGCELPALGKTIQCGAIRGVDSDGMCCALNELGVDPDYLPAYEVEGIHDLKDYPAGDKDILEHLGLKDELIDINILPNRPDCLSYLGMAREIAALTGRKFLGYTRTELSNLPEMVKAVNKSEACAKLEILTAELNGSPDSQVAESIQRYLELSGHRPISPIVDLGNYCMLLTGQPFHIYDLDLARTESFTCRDDHDCELVALDGKTYKVQPGDLTIDGDGERPLCLAGIMGGDASKDRAETCRIAVEAASFYHASIRHTSARLGLSSSSSILFGKGVNPRMCRESLEVFATVLKELFPQAVLTSFADDGRELPQNKPFDFSVERLNHRLGTSYSSEEVQRVLDAYGICWVNEHQVVGPTYRTDLTQQADVDEEVFRFYPADRVPLSYEGLPHTQGGLTEPQRQVRMIRDTLQGYGLSEIVSFTLETEEMSKSVRCFDDSEAYRVLNPLTKDHEYVRIDLVPSMVSILDRNASRKHSDLALYEISNVDSPKGRKELLCFGFLGQREDQDLKGARPYDFFDLKAVFEAVLRTLGITENRVRISRSKNPFFHPGKSADALLGKQVVATFGELTPAKFDRPYLVGEVDLSALLELRVGRVRQQPFGSHPSVRRDLSFDLVGGDVAFFDMVKTAKTASKLVRSIQLFDSYEDPHTGARSIGIALTLSADDHTLKDEEIDTALRAVATAVTSKLPLRIRGAKEQ